MPDYDGFISTVAERADAPPEEAERAACATLQTLAERLTAGETEDIAERLPAQLRSCLDGAGPFEAFHADEFLRRVGSGRGSTARAPSATPVRSSWRCDAPWERTSS